MQEMADPNREFRKHLVAQTQEEIDNEDVISMSNRMSGIYEKKSQISRKPSGYNVGTHHVDKLKNPEEVKAELLREVPEAPSDHNSEAPVSDAESVDGDE